MGLLLVWVIGCGGGATPGGDATNQSRFANLWIGLVKGSDGSDPNALLTISPSGVITGVEEVTNGTLSDGGSGAAYTMSGTIKQWGAFTITGKSPGLPDRIIAGVVSLDAEHALIGSGTMKSGSTQVNVTFTLSGNGTGTAGS